jgi:hypothetical protein
MKDEIKFIFSSLFETPFNAYRTAFCFRRSLFMFSEPSFGDMITNHKKRFGNLNIIKGGIYDEGI